MEAEAVEKPDSGELTLRDGRGAPLWRGTEAEWNQLLAAAGRSGGECTCEPGKVQVLDCPVHAETTEEGDDESWIREVAGHLRNVASGWKRADPDTLRYAADRLLRDPRDDDE